MGRPALDLLRAHDNRSIVESLEEVKNMNTCALATAFAITVVILLIAILIDIIVTAYILTHL